MQITIYLDIIFIINFLVDLFVLYLTGCILKQRIVFWRLIMGALLGAGAFLPFLTVPSLLYGKTGVIVCTGISMGAVYISLGRDRGFMKKWFLSTTIMVLLAGLMNGLRYKTCISVMKLCSFLVIFFTGALFCTFFIWFLQRSLRKEKNLYSVKIKNGAMECTVKLYLDTGNMLFDPLYGKPVLLLSRAAVIDCFEEEEREIIEQYNKKGRLDYEKIMTYNIQSKDCFHEILYQSVGNPTGKLLCFLADEVRIEGSDRILKKQPVAIIFSALFSGKEYQGLLHMESV